MPRALLSRGERLEQTAPDARAPIVRPAPGYCFNSPTPRRECADCSAADHRALRGRRAGNTPPGAVKLFEHIVGVAWVDAHTGDAIVEFFDVLLQRLPRFFGSARIGLFDHQRGVLTFADDSETGKAGAMAGEDGNRIERLLRPVDRFQQSHALLAFVYGVVKRYGEDRGRQLSGLIALDGFLSSSRSCSWSSP